ncbi:MAG: UDP-N-acetylmuramate--L-alanine ligase [Geminicoccaceae bacterium]
MRMLPIDVGMIHFVGIGGIGMSGIAEVLHALGHKVQGSDMASGANVERLRALGIEVMIGHAVENLGQARVVVISSAVKMDNPEVVFAREARIPVVKRAEMLAELMRLKWAIAVAGTHGKTTTTSLIATVLEAARFDPTVINGGIINAYGTNTRFGSSEWMVVEADESDGTFTRLPASCAVVTNIDPEHLDFYGDFDGVKAAFETFLNNLPFYGFAAMCVDHAETRALFERTADRRLIGYGFEDGADIRALDPVFDPDGAVFDVELRDPVTSEVTRTLRRLRLAMPGRHNVLNALAAIAVANELKIHDDVIRKALLGFGGVKRRFTKTGKVGGITVIDDYGHHPVEIGAALETAKAASAGKVIAVVQPHRYTRLEALFSDFCTCANDADIVLVAPVYAAGEAPIEGVDQEALVAGLRKAGVGDVQPVEGPEGLADKVTELAGPGDMVICLGAGTISAWANELPAKLVERLTPGHAA